MQSRLIIRSVFVLALAAPFAAHATPLGTKAGQWDGTVTTTSTGMANAIPKAQLDKMPPERRQQVEAYLKMREGKPITHESSGCIKPTDTVESMMSQSKDDNCTRKVIKNSGSVAEVNIVCHSADGKLAFKGHVKFKALSSTHVVSSMEMTNVKGVKTMAKGDSHWVSATCKKQPDGKP